MLACAGLAIALVLSFVYQPTDDPARAVAQPAAIWWGLLVATSAAVVALALLVQFRAPTPAIAGQAVVLLALFILLTPSYGFALGMSRVLMGVGAAWLLANVGGLLWQRARATAPTPPPNSSTKAMFSTIRWLQSVWLSHSGRSLRL